MGTIQSLAGDFLTRILADKRREIAARMAEESPAALAELAAAAPPARGATLRGATLRVIAEVKRGSPSAGVFNADLDAAAQAARYAAAGAAAISVLTDGPYFRGSLADLRAARAATPVALLRKDFILDAYQLLEARAHGADLVLLIVAALAPPQLASLLEAAHALGMEALVEINTADEARLATELGAPLVGINNRDLRTFAVDLATTERLRPLLPGDTVVASLSGVGSVDDARRMRDAGADAVLIGEALVRSADPAALIAACAGVR